MVVFQGKAYRRPYTISPH